MVIECFVNPRVGRGAEQRRERPAGRAKAEAESVVLENRDGNLIFRLSALTRREQ